MVTGSHSAQEATTYAGMAQEFGLAASRGSDFHSPDESRIDLGTLPDLPPAWDGLTILFLSDLHFIGVPGRPYFARVFARALERAHARVAARARTRGEAELLIGFGLACATDEFLGLIQCGADARCARVKHGKSSIQRVEHFAQPHVLGLGQLLSKTLDAHGHRFNLAGQRGVLGA